MKFKVYRMEFRSAVHFGEGKLTSSDYVFTAARLFSALCCESLHMDGEEGIERLVKLCRTDRLRFTDAFPYCNDDGKSVYYIPKPMLYVEHKEQEQGDSSLKKQSKKLKYIDISKIEKYLNGELDVREENKNFSRIGQSDVREMSTVKEADSAVPFPVGTFRFNKGWGLWFIVGYEDDETLYWIQDLLDSLGYSGIGGKRTAGLGQFELNFVKGFPLDMMDRFLIETGRESQYVLLSSAMADDNQLEAAMNGAVYSIGKTSGFVASETYADTLLKKKDYYYFESGSVFHRTFHGHVADVSNHGVHPVYGYYMPVFLEVSL